MAHKPNQIIHFTVTSYWTYYLKSINVTWNSKIISVWGHYSKLACPWCLRTQPEPSADSFESADSGLRNTDLNRCGVTTSSGDVFWSTFLCCWWIECIIKWTCSFLEQRSIHCQRSERYDLSWSDDTIKWFKFNLPTFNDANLNLQIRKIGPS